MAVIGAGVERPSELRSSRRPVGMKKKKIYATNAAHGHAYMGAP
jgi:hypothetical protein